MLVRRMTEVAAGHGSSVLIEGEPGIGKSTLVRAAALAQAWPITVKCSGEPVMNWGSHYHCCLWCRRITGAGAFCKSPSRIQSSGSCGANSPPIAARTCLLRWRSSCWRLSQSQLPARLPTSLVISIDLQWADQASITVWGRLARSVHQMPLLLVGMMRPVPQQEDLLALRRAVGDAALHLTGLTEAAVAKLVAFLAGGRPDNNLLRLAGGAAGNPLYITELVAALVRSSSVTITDAGAAELTNSAAPSSLSAAIASRLGFVSGPVREGAGAGCGFT